jgi:diguanylate cyclase (GGDEF)-like protein/PAS domain S-box-containing protein
VVIYALLATLWVGASDWVLMQLIDDPVLHTRIGMVKGILFVVVTSGLLFLLIKGGSTLSEAGHESDAAAPSQRPLLLTLAGLILVVPLLSLGIIQLYGPSLEREAYAKLQAVAALKSGQIENWLWERTADGRVLAANTALADRISSFLNTRAPQVGTEILAYLDTLRSGYEYGEVALLDADGHVLLGSHADTSDELHGLMRQAMDSGQALSTDIYSGQFDKGHQDWLVPMASTPRTLIVLHINTADFLYPLVQNWPTPSPSAESLLVRRAGDAVQFLSEPRHRREPPIPDYYPLQTPGLPAALAVSTGQAQVLPGRDYRGVEVFAATLPVPGTTWHLVSKIDRQEVMAPLKTLVFWVGLVSFFAILTVSAAVLILWRQQQRANRLALQAHVSEELRESEVRYRGLVMNLPGVVYRAGVDEQSTAIYVSDSIEELTGYPADEFVNNRLRSFISIIHPDDLRMFLDTMYTVTPGREAIVLEYRIRHRDGSTLWVHDRAHGSFDEQGRLQWVDGFLWDISDSKQGEERLRLAATVFENTQEGVLITDAERHILRVNHAFCELTGYSESEVLGKTPKLFQSGRHDQAFYARLWDSIRECGHWQGEIWNRRKNGEIYPELLNISSVRDDAGDVSHYVAVFTDITFMKDYENELYAMAHNDALTQLPNRSVLLSRLEHGIETMRRSGKRLALLLLDLDRFKDVNDSFGHPAGDEILQQVATRLSAQLRAVDTVARLGGDEFAVLLEDITHADDAARMANEIIVSMSVLWKLPNGVEVHIGTSIGISLFPDHGDTPEILLQQADAALYRAKDEGRGCFKYFSDELTRTARERIQLESRLRHALKKGQLRVYYQPQVDIISGRIFAAEALVRWQDPEKGLVMPGLFIPMAEETGLIREIGLWVLQATCVQGKKWMDAGLPPIVLAVNLAPLQLRHSGIVASVDEVLRDTGFPPERLELELTESALMQREEEAAEILHSLRALGVRLSIDDFGTGYSSLSHIKRFPIHTLKIDRGFIQDLTEDRDDREITSTIISMGHNLGLSVLAEGVETAEQLAFLKAQGCDSYQGYLRSPAVPAEAFAKLIS